MQSKLFRCLYAVEKHIPNHSQSICVLLSKMTEIALKRNRSTYIKKAIAFIILCVLLVVLDKVYSLTPSKFAVKTTIHSK